MESIISHANANQATPVNCVKHKSTNVNRALASLVGIAKIWSVAIDVAANRELLERIVK